MPQPPPCPPQLSSKLEAQRGAEAVNQLLGQLDAEWQHLKRLRLKYVGGPAAAAVSPSPPRSQVGSAWLPMRTPRMARLLVAHEQACIWVVEELQLHGAAGARSEL